MADITDTVAKDVWIVLPASADDNCISAIKGRTSVLRLMGSLLLSGRTKRIPGPENFEEPRMCTSFFFFFLTFLASWSVKLIHWFQNAAPVPLTLDGINFPCSAQITVASVTWRDLQQMHGGDHAGPDVSDYLQNPKWLPKHSAAHLKQHILIGLMEKMLI